MSEFVVRVKIRYDSDIQVVISEEKEHIYKSFSPPLVQPQMLGLVAVNGFKVQSHTATHRRSKQV